MKSRLQDFDVFIQVGQKRAILMFCRASIVGASYLKRVNTLSHVWQQQQQHQQERWRRCRYKVCFPPERSVCEHGSGLKQREWPMTSSVFRKKLAVPHG